ncbi:MAG: ATP-binding protein [Muribaculaceae bacterium]|nr:ATP-binding protein [Muribaculaceae bacterium]
MKTNLIARTDECAKLQRCMESDRSELVIVYGRRRVGKTYLIDEYFDRRYDFSCSGVHHGPKAMQLRNFAKQLKLAAGGATLPKFGDWMDAFDALEEYLGSLPTDRKKVLFFDEMPWMDTGKSDFVIALENFWNGWASRRKDIVMIATGSATSWMIDKMVDNHGGLHARVTCHLYLRQFTLGETEEYLRKRGCQWDRYQIMQCYMVTGGVPYYLSLLDVSDSIAQNINELFFAEKAELRNEFDDLYSALFRNAERYIEVVRILYDNKKGLTREEIGKLFPYPNDGLTQIINNLEQCDFIKSTAQFNKGAKLKVYKLVDFFTLFYYKFIKDNLSGNETWWTDNMNGPQISSWSGLAFERVCMAHVKEIKHALGISGVPTEVSTWKKNKTEDGDGAQIDLIIKRMDRMVHLCEMKFSTGKYNLTSDYEKRLRERQAIFEQCSKTRYGVLHTFVTTYGVAEGKNKSIVHSEVTMEDLFHTNS